MFTKVTPVRPYWSEIREKMWNHISVAGFTIDGADIIGVNDSDEQIMSALKTRKDHILLVPYNASASNETAMKTGLDIVFSVNKNIEILAQSPILMPVASALTNALRKELAEEREGGRLTPELDKRILFIAESDLNRPELAQRIRRHVQKVYDLQA